MGKMPHKVCEKDGNAILFYLVSPLKLWYDESKTFLCPFSTQFYPLKGDISHGSEEF
jgi:hypothetical protein